MWMKPIFPWATPTPSEFFSQLQLKSLAQAAVHLDKARAIDPTEALWVEDEKEEVKKKFTQDYLTSRVLTYEGAAHLQFSRRSLDNI